MMTCGSESRPEGPGTMGLQGNASVGLVVTGVGSGRVGGDLDLVDREIDAGPQLYWKRESCRWCCAEGSGRVRGVMIIPFHR